MHAIHDSLRVEEQVRANEIVTELARRLGSPTAEEPLLELAEIPLLWASHGSWRLDVYLELKEADLDRPTGLWVLILSRGEDYYLRTFEGNAFAEAVAHVQQFTRDRAYSQRWLDRKLPG